MIKPLTDQEIVCVWPDGSWCYKDELSEMDRLSDDFAETTFEYMHLYVDGGNVNEDD